MRGEAGLWLGAGLWMAACRWAPGVAAGWQGVAIAALTALNGLTSAVPFPLAELFLLALVGMSMGRGGLRRAGRVLCAAWVAYALLWYPAYYAEKAESWPEPEPAVLEALCQRLSDELNGPPEAADLREAPAVAGVAGAVVKGARYPEWMWGMGIAGLFFPWTGEVIVDARAPADCLPFTCVHELMHLRGIADEGAANIAAYRACEQWGGGYARSARLWALQCAVERLCHLDAQAAGRVTARLDGDVAQLVEAVEPASGPNLLARLLGIGRQTTDYDALVGWLAFRADVLT